MWKPFAKLQINPFLSELRLEYCRVTSASRTSTSKLPPTTMERLTNVFSVLDLDVEDDRPSAAASSSSSPVMRRWTMDNLFAGKEKKAVKNDKPNQQERVAPSGAYSMPLVWIDLEMTGLDVEVDRIIEIACIITDGKLTKLVEGPELVIHQTEDCMNKMGEWCQTHHGASGLTERVIQSTVSEREAELQVIEFIKKHVGTYTPQIAGNSVYMDLLFIRKYMPDLASLFSHVIVDVSSVRSLCIRWYRKDHERAPAKSNKHRALDDIKESINELKYYKESIFKAKKSK
ncbi:At2g26970 [Linum perenne]